MPTAYIDIEEFAGPKGYMEQIDLSDENAGVIAAAILLRATAIVEDFLGFGFADYVNGVKNIRAGYGAYLRIPAHEPDSVTLVADMAGNDMDGYWQEISSGSVYAVSDDGYEGNWNAGMYAVTADWGYGPAPAAAKEVVLELAVNIWRSRSAGHFTNIVGAVGGGAVGYEKALTPQQAMILNNLVRKHNRIVAI